MNHSGSDGDDLVPAQICGNVAARAVLPAKERGVRMRTGRTSQGGQGFVSEEDAAQALLML